MIPETFFPSQFITIVTWFRCVGVGPQVPDHVPTNGWPSWANSNRRNASLWNNAASPIDGLLISNHQVARPIIVLADVLREFRIGTPTRKKTGRPGPRVSTGIIDRDFDLHVVMIRTRELLDEVQLVGMGCTLAFHPEPLIEADRVNNQRIA